MSLHFRVLSKDKEIVFSTRLVTIGHSIAEGDCELVSGDVEHCSVGEATGLSASERGVFHGVLGRGQRAGGRGAKRVFISGLRDC